MLQVDQWPSFRTIPQALLSQPTYPTGPTESDYTSWSPSQPAHPTNQHCRFTLHALPYKPTLQVHPRVQPYRPTLQAHPTGSPSRPTLQTLPSGPPFRPSLHTLQSYAPPGGVRGDSRGGGGTVGPHLPPPPDVYSLWLMYMWLVGPTAWFLAKSWVMKVCSSSSTVVL